MTATLADWVVYAEARGLDTPTGTDAETALVRGGDYIRYTYANRFGCTLPPDDVLDAATYIAAQYELASPGFWSKVYKPGQQKVLTQAGDIEWTPVKGANVGNGASPVSTQIEGMLGVYLRAFVGLWSI